MTSQIKRKSSIGSDKYIKEKLKRKEYG